jgi:xanthine dehydrogenase YagR molybdenum-binding subunit
MSTPTPTPTPAAGAAPASGAAPAKKMKRVKMTKVVNGVDTEVEVEVEDTGDGPTWGARKDHTLVNTRLERIDAPVKVTGAAKYTHDIRLPGMLYARVLRCPHPHAKVKGIDFSAADAIPGVKATLRTPVLPNDEVVFEGQPVAAVAAVHPDVAEDALRAIKVEYEVLPHVVDPAAALKPDAPPVFAVPLPVKPDAPATGGSPNLEVAKATGDPAKTDAAFAGADVLVEGDYKTPIIHHCSLETHGHVIDYRGGDSATVYATTQGIFSVKADAVKQLGLPDPNVTIICEYMGGGFGAKFGTGIEGQLAIELSKKAKAPIHLLLTRRDEFAIPGNRSGSWQTMKAGATKDGRLVALRAYQRRLGGIAAGAQAVQPYVYQFENSYSEMVSVHTNECPSRAMRAPGHLQASYAMEMVIDELAHKVGMDGVEFRKKNVKPGAAGDPWRRQLDRGAKAIGWERRNKTPGGGPGPLKRGIGCAIGTWGGGGNKECQVTLDVSPDGAVVVKVGSQDLGTGTRTFTRAIVAEELGLGMKDVQEKIGDSRLGRANGSGGSTTSASLSPAVKDAAWNARKGIAEKVAPLLKVEPDKVVFANGKVTGGTQSLTWKQACATLPSAGLSVRGEWKPGLSDTGTHGASFAEVEVDVETGRVRPIKMVHVQDCGLPLSRTTLESQINGGMIMSLGMALWEGNVKDAELGLRLNPSFMDYKICGTLEIPELVPIIDDEDPREAVIGIGEPSLIPSLAAVINAVYNACGVRIHELPATPDKVLMALLAQQEKKA